jgi:hypothetical protein
MSAVSGMAPSGASGINNSGQIVGQCGDILIAEVFACVVANGTVTALPQPNLGCLTAVAINNSGQVLGNCYQYDNTLAWATTSLRPRSTTAA